MYFYSIVISILRRFPPGKWVPLGQTVEDESKFSDFFTGFICPMLHFLMIFPHRSLVPFTLVLDNPPNTPPPSPHE